jgi:hypothetical protein
MRLMLTFSIPTERSNRAATDGTLGQAIDNLLQAAMAEACDFTMVGGKRGLTQ